MDKLPHYISNFFPWRGSVPDVCSGEIRIGKASIYEASEHKTYFNIDSIVDSASEKC